jgi:hypothetical protein
MGFFVFNQKGIDRRFYELAVMTELKNALRAGDISVVGSRVFKDFDDYLMPKAEFDRQHAEDRLVAIRRRYNKVSPKFHGLWPGTSEMRPTVRHSPSS